MKNKSWVVNRSASSSTLLARMMKINITTSNMATHPVQGELPMLERVYRRHILQHRALRPSHLGQCQLEGSHHRGMLVIQGKKWKYVMLQGVTATLAEHQLMNIRYNL